MSVKSYYIKADFVADFSGKKFEKEVSLSKRAYQAAFSNVVLRNLESLKRFNKNEYRLGDDYIDGLNIDNAYISLGKNETGEEIFSKAAIKEGILRNPVIIESGKAGGTTVGKVRGTLYAVVERRISSRSEKIIEENVHGIYEPDDDPVVADTENKKTNLTASSHNGKSFNGCFTAVLWILLVIFLLSLLSHGAPWLWMLFKIVFAFLGISLLFFLLGRLLKALSGIAAFIIAFIIILSLFSYLFSHNTAKDENTVRKDGKNENSQLVNDSTMVENDSSACKNNPLCAIHHRRWVDFTPTTFEGNIIMSQCNYALSRQNRESLNPVSNNPIEVYNGIYSSMASFDQGKMQLVYKLFDSLRTVQNLDEYKFADLIVTCVQDIPYRLVVDNPNELDGRMLELYKQEGALEHIKFGVQAPAEFMYNLQGDCDTRALFCYTVFDHYGYDVALLVSEYYSHAVLGLSLPTLGEYISYNGKRYYTWETTSKGFQRGQMAPDCDNMKYWNIVLANK